MLQRATRKADRGEQCLMQSIATNTEPLLEPGTRLSAARLSKLSTFHKVLPQTVGLLERLERNTPGIVDDLDALRRELRDANEATLRLVNDVQAPLRELSASFPVMLAKGAQLSAISSVPRIMRDIDVFVREVDVDAALAICSRHGFEAELSRTDGKPRRADGGT